MERKKENTKASKSHSQSAWGLHSGSEADKVIQSFWEERGIGVAKEPSSLAAFISSRSSTSEKSLDSAQDKSEPTSEEFPRDGVARSSKPKFYHLVMFPYPSGDLHVGHWKNFSVADIIARKKLLDGYNLLSPIGFDAFGLPAENAAIKRGIDPHEWTKKNIASMTGQLKAMGPVYDWSRLINTSDPEYYRWTQWLFLLMYKQGLAYRAKTHVNWCPKDQTVLANEQVKGGKCDLCGSEVVQKEQEQWSFKVTEYADQLFDDLDTVDWPEPTKVAQRNWIGRSKGRLIKFQVTSHKAQVEVFTTRPDTIRGATYLVVAPEHEILENLKFQTRLPDGQVSNLKEVSEYINQAKNKTELERQKYDKSGVDTGLKAINPVTKEEIPIWIADYVLSGYGTGAIMAVPAHDERDREFAQKHGLPIGSGELEPDIEIGGAKTNYKLRDWIVSRQRYWGAPIPMIKCDDCGYQPVPEKDLPVILPDIKDYLPKGKPPLATAPTDWLTVNCPKCHGSARREVETLDTFVDSSWYFLRFADPNNSKSFADREKLKHWLPVDLYIGGAEHIALHLLYARFVTKVLHDSGYIDFDEPFMKLRHQGLLLGPDHQKMSKSRGNVVDPDELVAHFGSDPVRLYLAFMGPYDQGGPWNTDGFQGAVRFLKRVERLQITDYRLQIGRLDSLIKKVTEDTDQLKFNTAIATMMSFLNEVEKEGLDKESYRKFLILLAPYSPHTAEKLWQDGFPHPGGEDPDPHPRGERKSIFEERWPEFDQESTESESVTIPVMINDKRRTQITLSPEATEDEAVKVVKESSVGSLLKEKTIKRVVYKAGRIINFVVE